MISKNPVYLDIPISIIFSIMNVGVVLRTAVLIYEQILQTYATEV